MCTCDNQLQPHPPLAGVCPELDECDDCFRTDGTHDPEVEH